MKKEELLDKLLNQRLFFESNENEDDINCILTIKNEKMVETETIMFDMIDADYKYNFIDQAYDENLINKSAPFISITDIRFFIAD
jgi:hypothetical protein